MNLERLLDRHEAFLACAEVDRPLIGAWCGGYYPTDQFPIGTSHWRDGQGLHATDLACARFAPDYERLYRLHRDARDDFFYVGCPYWGFPWMEAILGCRVAAAPSSCHAHACLTGLADAAHTRGLAPDERWIETLVQLTRDVVELADGRFPICPPLLRGPGDCASAMLGPMAFVTGCIDDPASVQALLAHCAETRASVLRRLDDAIPAWHGTHAAGGYPSKVWSRRKVAYCQEDSAALLNPSLFRSLLLPLHRKIARTTPVSFIHLHSACLYPLDILLEDGTYTVIEVNIDHAGVGPPLRDLLPVFRRIQEASRPLLLWGCFEEEDWDLMRRELSPVGLSLQPIVTGDEFDIEGRWT